MKNRFVVKNENESTPRKVEVLQRENGVILIVNDCTIARLDDDDDRLILVGGVTKNQTGLAEDYGNRIKTVWDSDKETSRGRY